MCNKWFAFVPLMVIVNVALLYLDVYRYAVFPETDSWNVELFSSNGSFTKNLYSSPPVANNSQPTLQGILFGRTFNQSFLMKAITTAIPTFGRPTVSIQPNRVKRKENGVGHNKGRFKSLKKMPNRYSTLPRDFHDFSAMENILTRPHRDIRVRYIPRIGVGFGNMFRSFRSFLLFSIYDNFTFCIDYEPFFDVMNSSLEVLRCKPHEEKRRWSNNQIDRWAVNGKCKNHIDKSIAVKGSNDLIRHFVVCNEFLKKIDEENLPVQSKRVPLTYYLSRFLFQPKQTFIDYGNEVLNEMKGVKVGVQLRFGGSFANSWDSGVFLKPERMDSVLRKIQRLMGNQDYSIFLASDSAKAPKLLAPLNKTIHVAKQFEIGHTKNRGNKYLDRAILDLYILSRCDVLFTTFYSTFGNLAREVSLIQHSYEIRCLFVCYHTC